jgi:glycolate oxidase FAD binding subunit
MKTDNLRRNLQSEFGDAVELENAAAVSGVLPQCLAAPKSEEAAHALVTWCGKSNVAFVVLGGGTKTHIGAAPSRCDLLISTRHLNSVIEHDEGNARVQAQSGILLDDLEKAVGERGQFVPLDWSTPGAATLGGVVASNHYGATKLRYGAPRDLVVGLRAALSDGRDIQAGSKVVKNVSGYDLNKLFVGSFGTLGLLTQVTIRLRPNDARRENWQKNFASWQEAENFAQQILSGPFEPAILRVVVQENEIVLQARFDGGEAAVNSQMEKLPPQANAPLKLYEELEKSELELRATLPIARASAWAQSVLQTGANRVLWDCGLGEVRAAFMHLPDNAETLVKKMRAQATQYEGFLVVERAPDAMKNSDFVWGAPRADFVLMQKLKRAFDGANACAPGRLIGGL